MNAVTISESAYAVMNWSGFKRLMAIAGGVTFRICVAPVMVISAVKEHEAVASGHTFNCHVEPCGEIAEFDGTLCEYAPAPSREPPIVWLSFPPVQVYCAR